MNRLSPHAAFWLTVVRIYLGVFWLVHGLSKLAGGAPAVIPSWYHGMLVHIIVQNAHTLLPIVAAVEVAAGALLVFGLFTRLSAFVALVLAVGFMLTKGDYMSYSGVLNTSGSLVVLALLTFATAADFGVDGIRRAIRERQGSGGTERVQATPVDVKWPE